MGAFYSQEINRSGHRIMVSIMCGLIEETARILCLIPLMDINIMLWDY